MNDVLKRGEIWRQKYTQGECRIKRKAEIGVMQQNQGMPQIAGKPPEAMDRHGKDSPSQP